jgi:hypothetical protein
VRQGGPRLKRMPHAGLADWIEKHIEQLTARWIDAVRRDPRIHSDGDLSEDGLRDHIPAVIEEICDLLRTGELPAIGNTREARVHAYVRFRQGYRARELVRELSLLRLSLLDHLSKSVSESSVSVSMESFVAGARFINMYIDEEMSYAVSVYVEALRPKEEQPRANTDERE